MSLAKLFPIEVLAAQTTLYYPFEFINELWELWAFLDVRGYSGGGRPRFHEEMRMRLHLLRLHPDLPRNLPLLADGETLNVRAWAGALRQTYGATRAIEPLPPGPRGICTPSQFATLQELDMDPLHTWYSAS